MYITTPAQPGYDFARIYEFSVDNKTATANNYNLDDQRPNSALDGSTSTKWCSVGTGDRWLTIDLGAPVEVHNWTVKHAGAGGESTILNTRDFKLQVSNDNVNFTDADIVTGNTSNITSRTVQTVIDMIVRVDCSM